MAYAFVQQNAADAASQVGTITVTLTPTAGNLLVFCVTGDSLDFTTLTLSDNLGSHNTFTQISTYLVTAGNQRCSWWYAENCKGGATTFTATYSSTTRFRTIYVAEYSGIATSGSFLDGARAENNGPGTGTDAVSSGNANATLQPALVWGFSIDVDGTSAPTAGTGFTSRTNVWSSATCQARPEDKRVTATGNVAATFTATTGTDGHATGIGIFAETGATASIVDDDAAVVSVFVPIVPRNVSVAPNNGEELPITATVLDGNETAIPPLPWQAPALAFALRAIDDDLPSSAAPTMVEDEPTLPFAPVPAQRWYCGSAFDDDLPTAAGPSIIDDDIPISGRLSIATWEPRRFSTLNDEMPISSVFPLSVEPGGRYLLQADGTPFLICADTTWSLAVNVATTDINTFLNVITGQGFNGVMMNIIEHHYTVVKPPSNVAGRLPFTKRLDGASYTGSPNGTTGAAGTQGQFASDAYSSISTQSPDPTFINNAYWLDVETILNACLAHNVAVFVWVAYLGFHNDDEGWLNEMVEWNAVTGAGGFTGFGFANPAKSKIWNYGAWLADRWKAYPHLVWVMGGDYGSNSQGLSAPQKAAIEQLADGMKSVAGQLSTLFTAHWDRPAIATDTSLATVTFDLNLAYCDEAVAEVTRRGYAHTPVIPTFLGEYFYENDLFGGSAPYRKYVYWGFLGGIAGGFFGNEQLWRFDDGTPGTDYTTIETTQATLDASRQFAFWKSKPWHRLVPNGLGGIGTLITAGGGTASPQSTNYVAAAMTPQGDLLLAYIPPAHTGSVTIDMSKLTAQITASWFDPTDSSITAIGSFANTGTHAFTPPATNNAGDTDFLLVLETSGAVAIEEISSIQLPLCAETRNWAWWKPWWPYDAEDVPITPTSAIDDHEDVVGTRVPQQVPWMPSARVTLDEDFAPVTVTIDDGVAPVAVAPSQQWVARAAVLDEDFVAAVLDEDAPLVQVPVSQWAPRTATADDDLPVASAVPDEDTGVALRASGVAWVVAPVTPDDDLPSAPPPTMVDDQASTAPPLAQLQWVAAPRPQDVEDFPAAAVQLEDEGAWDTGTQQANGWCAILRQYEAEDLPPPAVVEDVGWTYGTGWTVPNLQPPPPDPDDVPIAGPPAAIIDEDPFVWRPAWPLVWSLRATMLDDDIGGIDTGPADGHVHIPGTTPDPEVYDFTDAVPPPDFYGSS